jgi:hypothetical protein
MADIEQPTPVHPEVQQGNTQQEQEPQSHDAREEEGEEEHEQDVNDRRGSSSTARE